jgi:hypothetical protein
MEVTRDMGERGRETKRNNVLFHIKLATKMCHCFFSFFELLLI